MKHLVISGLAAAVALTSLSANAERPFTAEHPQVGVRVGYGVYVGDETAGDFNPYGIGVGLTTGYTFNHLYLGVTAEYYVGAVAESLRDEASGNIWSAMAEPGYDIILGTNWMLRPQIGVGVSSLHVEQCVPFLDENGAETELCQDETDYKLAVAPGAMLFLDDLGGFYGQVGVRYHHPFVEEGTAGGVLINAGVGAAW